MNKNQQTDHTTVLAYLPVPAEPSYAVGENVKWCHHFGKQLFLRRPKGHIPYNPATQLLDSHPREVKAYTYYLSSVCTQCAALSGAAFFVMIAQIMGKWENNPDAHQQVSATFTRQIPTRQERGINCGHVQAIWLNLKIVLLSKRNQVRVGTYYIIAFMS